MTLDEKLRRFYAVVVGAAPVESARDLVESDRVDAATRLGVYVHAYHARLADVLVGDYPKLDALVGVRPLVAAYLRAHPPHHPSLREAGARIAEFLAARGEPAHLVELARLERARMEAFDGGADVPTLTRDHLEALGPAAFPTLQLRLVPSSQLLELTTNADDIWDAIESERAAPEPIASARSVLVWRRDVTVIHRTLARDEARAVRLLVSGTTFETACEALADTPDPVSRALELLLKWLDGGILERTRSRRSE